MQLKLYLLLSPDLLNHFALVLIWQSEYAHSPL